MLTVEMGTNSNPLPARTNQTRTQVLPRTELNRNPKVKNVQEPEPGRILPQKEPELKCHASY